jgi:hypothetical protein
MFFFVAEEHFKSKEGKMMNKFLTAAALTLAMALPVQAAEQGRLDILLEYDGQPLNGTFEVIPVAEYNAKTGTLEFEQEFTGCGVDLTDLTDAQTSAIIAQWASDNSLEGLEFAAENGSGSVNLDEGLYLICQTDIDEGYEASNPFLVMLPDDTGNFVITAHPKTNVLVEEPEEPETPSENKGEAGEPEETPKEETKEETKQETTEKTKKTKKPPWGPLP